MDIIKDLIHRIDNIPCHPKNKLLLYHRFILPKISWHLTIADLNKRWVIEILDNIAVEHVRRWFDLPVSATFKSNKGINLNLPSTNFIKYQTIIRNALKSSPTSDIKSLWHDSESFNNIQYDQFRNTKKVLKSIQTHHYHHITNELTSQGLVISLSLKYASQTTIKLWSNVQQRLPQNIFNFTLKNLTNTLATRKNCPSGPLLNYQCALFVFNLKPCNVLSLVVNYSFNMVGIPRDMSLS